MSDVRLVTTTSGKLRGRLEDSVSSFLGIPYAEPPLGDLRFKAPRPVNPWIGERDALSWPNRAVQPLRGGLTDRVDGDEDCLYLNIWTPDLTGNLPVVFFVHGGAFIMGSANDYDGASLASSGLVVVTVNYRVGAFGYLYLGELAPGVADSNLALRDLTTALEWVAANAKCFGGDPAKIILAGRSSGAMTVGALMTTGRANPNFSAAWLMSGAARQVRSIETATRSAEMFLHAVGLESSDANLVVDLPTAVLAHATATLSTSEAHDEAFDAEVMLPVVGDEVLPVLPLDAISNGACDGKTVVASWTAKDMDFFRKRDPEKGVRNKELYAKRLFGLDWWSQMEALYARTGTDPYIDLLTDFHFALPAIRLVQALAGRAKSARLCRFDETPRTPPWPDLGPVHTCDAFYLFTPLTPPTEPTDFGVGTGMLDEDRSLAKKTRRIFLAMGEAIPFEENWSPSTGENSALSLSDRWGKTEALPAERFAAWGDLMW